MSPAALRVALLKEEYSHFIAAPATLIAKLERLSGLYGHAAVAAWKKLALGQRWDELTEDLLVKHYDPAYTRSTLKHYPALSGALQLELRSTDEAEFMRLARECLAREERDARGDRR